MSTNHCFECADDENECRNGHLYVVEFRPEIATLYQNQSEKGYLYVGSTEKTVAQRFRDNFIRANGEIVDREQLRKQAERWPEDGQWKYTSSSAKKIRRYYWRHRPDLLYYAANPIELDSDDPDRLERRERRLLRRLENRGWRVQGPRPREQD